MQDPTVVSIATQQHEPTSVVVQGSSQGALTQGDNAGCMQTTTHGTVMNNVCGFQLFLPLVNTPPPSLHTHPGVPPLTCEYDSTDAPMSTRASPKSASLNRPSPSTRMLGVFTSPW